MADAPPKPATIEGTGFLSTGAHLIYVGNGMRMLESRDSNAGYLVRGNPLTDKALFDAVRPSYPPVAKEYLLGAVKDVVSSRKVKAPTSTRVDGVTFSTHDGDEIEEDVVRFVPSSSKDRWSQPRYDKGNLVVFGYVDTAGGVGEGEEACATFAPRLLDAFVHNFVAVGHAEELLAQIARIHNVPKVAE